MILEEQVSPCIPLYLTVKNILQEEGRIGLSLPDYKTIVTLITIVFLLCN